MAVEQGRAREVIQEAVRVLVGGEAGRPARRAVEPVEPLPTTEAVDAMYRIGATDVWAFAPRR